MILAIVQPLNTSQRFKSTTLNTEGKPIVSLSEALAFLWEMPYRANLFLVQMKHNHSKTSGKLHSELIPLICPVFIVYRILTQCLLPLPLSIMPMPVWPPKTVSLNRLG